MIHRLYKEFAEYYVAMNNSRDFKEELACILNTYEVEHPCSSFIELFAGQASHSVEALKKGGIDVWAIDSSEDMKQLAIGQGFEPDNQYIVGNLPEAILSIPPNVKFDCVACLCYGLTNLNVPDMFNTLNHIKGILNKNGKLFIEVHNVAKVLEYISTPLLRYEEFTDSTGRTIKYAWPSGKVRWNPLSYLAEVPVTLRVPSAEGEEKIDIISNEYIHSTDYILFLANILGYQSKILSYEPVWQEAYANSVVIELTLA